MGGANDYQRVGTNPLKVEAVTSTVYLFTATDKQIG